MKKYFVVKPSVSILGTTIVLMGLFIPIGVYIYFNKIIGILIILLYLYGSVQAINLWFFQSIKISKEGVEYITPNLNYNMTWDDIGTIGITNRSPGFKKWIYFSRNKEPVTFVLGDISQDLFVMNYRKAIIHEVRKYWSNEIANR